MTYDAVVILGYPPHTKKQILQGRLEKGRRYATKHHLPIIVTGQGRLNENEADYMAAWLLAHQFRGPIIKERRAWDTIENFAYTRPLMRQHHFQRVLVVTSWFHALRAGLLMRLFLHQCHLLLSFRGGWRLFWADLRFLPQTRRAAHQRGFI